MLTTERLLAAAGDLWRGYNDHPFVLGIQNSDLDREKFRFYTIQDYLYLLDYAKVFAVGLSKSDDPAVMHTCAQYITQVMDYEMDVHTGYMAALSISPDALRAAKPALANRSYTAYMLACAHAGGAAEALAAVLACALSYEHIAREIVRRRPDAARDSFYGAWIASYTSDQYARENDALCAMLNRLTEHCTEAQLTHLTEIFHTCARYEAGFWDMAWNMAL